MTPQKYKKKVLTRFNFLPERILNVNDQSKTSTRKKKKKSKINNSH